MNDLQILIDKCRQRNGYPVSLRSIWAGRGATVTERRAKVKTLFGDQQEVKETQMVKESYIENEVPKEREVLKDVVVARIVFDKQKGIYQLSN